MDWGRERNHPYQAIGMHMGEEEKNIKQNQGQKKGTGSKPPTQPPGPFGGLLQPTWIIRWAYSETCMEAYREEKRKVIKYIILQKKKVN